MKELLAEHKEHWEHWGFSSDLSGATYLGVPQDTIRWYRNISSEFTPDGGFAEHNHSKIVTGTLRVYGEKILTYAVSVEDFKTLEHIATELLEIGSGYYADKLKEICQNIERLASSRPEI